jgi:hypothetical protein
MKLKTKNSFRKKFTHPYSIQPEKLVDMLGNLRFKKYTRIGSLQDFVFHLNELTTLSVDLKQVLENMKSEDCVMGISMFDHTQSVISNNKRTSFLLWIDSKGLNLVFGEIQSDVPRDTAKNFFEWTQVPQVALSITPDENEIEQEKEQLFAFNKVNGYTNKKMVDLSFERLKSISIKR